MHNLTLIPDFRDQPANAIIQLWDSKSESKSKIRSKQQSLSNEPKYHIPAGQPDQIIFVLVEGDVLLGIDIFEGGVVGAVE